MYANLLPAELDVDVGSPFGLQLQQQPTAAVPTYLQPGDSFRMDIRVNSTSSQLYAFQVTNTSPKPPKTLVGTESKCS